MRRESEWAAGLMLSLLLAACGRPLTHARELITATPPRPDGPAPTPAATMVRPPVLTPATLPTAIPQPTPVPTLAALPTTIPQPTPVPTPFPDIPAIEGTVQGTGASEHWASYLTSGSFTARGAEERLALVGNIGDHNEVRWVVIGQGDEGWRLLGTSGCLGSGLDAPPSFNLPPDVLDFDEDGRQEVLSHCSKTQDGWKTSTDTLYRWNGHALASVWAAPTAMSGTAAGDPAVPQSYRVDYRADWEWIDLDGKGPDEILLREHTAFYEPDGEKAKNSAASAGEEGGERAFRWDGEAFRPYAPDGPDGTFAYVARGDVWLWQDHTARPLRAEHVQDMQWSPDGLRLAWWSQPPPESASERVVLGTYDLTTGVRRDFALEGEALALRWAPDGRLTTKLPDRPPVILDLKSGQQEPLPVATLPTWSPDGSQMAYEQDGSLLETFGGREATGLRLAWSPCGSRLAALAIAPPAAPQPADLGAQPSHRAILYLAEVAHREDDPVGRPAWKETLELEAVTQTVGLAWSPDGNRLALAAGAELWEVSAAGETTRRHRFSFPPPRWKTLEWAPDGSGVLAGLESAPHDRLYWFPADGGEPVLLVADGLGSAHWAPRATEAQASPQNAPPMVLVEYGHYKPRLHFVRRDGSDVVVRANGASSCTPFQVGGQRVYYDRTYVEGRRVRSLRAPDAPDRCHPPLVSPDGNRLAWLCDASSPDWQALVDGTAEIHFQLIVTDGRGRTPREVWHHVETGPDCRSIHPMGWSADGAVVYLSQPKYGVAWAYFEYNPGILALDVNTGQATQVGDLDDVHDGLVSPDGAWLVQSRIAKRPGEGESVTLRSLVEEMERTIACAQGTLVTGDFLFSPENTWLAWREWARGPAGGKVMIRALRLPDGEPFTVYEDKEDIAPRIGGWLGKDDLVLVYPLRKDGTGAYSTTITLPATGPGYPFSPFVFVGVLD